MRPNKFFLFFFLVLASCGKAPAFNHAPAADSRGISALSSEQKALGLFVQLRFEQDLNTDELLSFVLIFRNEKGVLEDPKMTPNIAPNMPNMGHGTSPVLIKRLSQGIWRVEEVSLYMPGLWRIPVTFISEGQVQAEIFWDLNL